MWSMRCLYAALPGPIVPISSDHPLPPRSLTLFTFLLFCPRSALTRAQLLRYTEEMFAQTFVEGLMFGNITAAV